MHIAGHEEGEKKCQCTDCGKGFGVKRSMNQYMKEMHSKAPEAEQGKKKFKCSYCDKEIFVKKNWVAHEKRCPGNPNRKVYTCPICGESKWYSIGELNTHMKKLHNVQ